MSDIANNTLPAPAPVQAKTGFPAGIVGFYTHERTGMVRATLAGDADAVVRGGMAAIQGRALAMDTDDDTRAVDLEAAELWQARLDSVRPQAREVAVGILRGLDPRNGCTLTGSQLAAAMSAALKATRVARAKGIKRR